MGLFDDLLEPLKEIREVSAQFREEVVSSVGQVADEVTRAKAEGSALVSDIAKITKPDGEQKAENLDKRETIQ